MNLNGIYIVIIKYGHKCNGIGCIDQFIKFGKMNSTIVVAFGINQNSTIFLTQRVKTKPYKLSALPRSVFTFIKDEAVSSVLT